MKLKNFFNVVMYSFFMIVPLVPLKIKLKIFPVAPDFIIGGVAIVIGIMYIITNWNRCDFSILKRRDIKLFSVFIFLFALISAGSYMYARSKPPVISETMRFAEYILLFYLVLIIADENFIRRGFIIFYLVMIGAALYGVAQFVFDLSPFRDYGQNLPFNRGRLYSTFENPNYWGAAINLVIFIPIINLIENKNNKKTYDLIVLAIFMFNLLFSYTRGSWIGFAIGLFVICILKYKKVLAVFPVLGAMLLAVPSTRMRVISIFNTNYMTNSERIKLWKTGLAMFKEHFWLGVGNGNYNFQYPVYVAKYRELYMGRPLFSVHNSYIKVLAELGITGGVLFLSICFIMLYFVYKFYKNSREYGIWSVAFLAAFTSYLFQNFFNNLMFIPRLNVFIWIIIAMLYKSMYYEKSV